MLVWETQESSGGGTWLSEPVTRNRLLKVSGSALLLPQDPAASNSAAHSCYDFPGHNKISLEL